MRSIMLSPDHTPSHVARIAPCRPAPRRPNRRILSGAMLSIALLAASAASEVRGQAVQLVAVDIKQVGEGYQASKLIGTRVVNDNNDKIGTLDDLIVAKDRSLFAILQVGGFLGLGGWRVAVPYDSLDISDNGRKIELAGGSKEALQKLPEYKK